MPIGIIWFCWTVEQFHAGTQFCQDNSCLSWEFHVFRSLAQYSLYSCLRLQHLGQSMSLRWAWYAFLFLLTRSISSSFFQFASSLKFTVVLKSDLLFHYDYCRSSFFLWPQNRLQLHILEFYFAPIPNKVGKVMWCHRFEHSTNWGALTQLLQNNYYL